MARPRLAWITIAAVALVLLGLAPSAGAQYFGRNKVQYRTFDFHILKTEHFDLYYYPEEREAAEIVGRMAERWHARLGRFFGQDLSGRQPIILYAAGTHFRQTNAVEGMIGEGTGGVTEALKRRIVLPMSGSLADTDHVLGHELVHAFQFDLSGTNVRDIGAQSPGILAFPLWFVEGMAEDLTLGPVDAQTSMWLRDAALRERLPSVRELEDPRIFPYRWGHAFWAFVGARYGDRAVASLVRSAANPRFDLDGLTLQLGTDPETLTADWHDAIRQATFAVIDAMPGLASEPRHLIGQHNDGGRLNVGPRVSPDGRHVAFFSERDRFSIELFLADVETGVVVRKLLKTAADPHFDSLEFLRSAGAWSPDGSALVVTASKRGRSVIAFINPRNGRITREVTLDGLDDALNPAFAPDGKSIVVSGNTGGLFDLYRYWLDKGTIERLTSDSYADLEPVFTPDGQSIVFVTERFSFSMATLEPGPLRLARLNIATGDVEPIAAFLKGKHLSPQVSSDGAWLTFIAEPDGVSNVYRMPLSGGPTMQLTAVPTGVAGVTEYSPALTEARTGRLVFSVFEDDGHALYVLDPDRVVSLVPPEATYAAARIPGVLRTDGDVARLLGDFTRGLPEEASTEGPEPYGRSLSLDTIGQPTIAGSVNSLGTQVRGSVSAFFSDMLGDRALGVQGQVGGSWADLGGEVVYVNRKHRWNWAASAAVSPYSVGYLTRADDAATGNPIVQEVVERQTSRGVTAAAAFPLNISTRLEVNGAAQHITFTREIRTEEYSAETRRLIEVTEREFTDANPLNLAQAGVALVYDTTFFGATAPVFGARSRLAITESTGTMKYRTVVLDWRRYFMPKRPVTIAVRGLHVARYGADSESGRLVDLYLGHPEYVHGYGVGTFGPAECRDTSVGAECEVFNSLVGSRLAVVNVEVRAPLKSLFTGELEYGRFPVDLAAFMDTGVAWTKDSHPAFAGGDRDIVRSVGAAVRANLFGFLVLEVAASRPFDRVERGLRWQVAMKPGF